jgi:hypothetical protein
MASFNQMPPHTFRPMNPASPLRSYLCFHQAIIIEFNKPKRKKVISWFVINYVGELFYMYHGRRITSVCRNHGTPYLETVAFS